MSTTIKDFGRHSERFGDIPFYYAFPIKFWFQQAMLIPEDVLTWCRENCTGCYKVVQYTHEDSRKNGDKYLSKIMYVDKIYLADESDAALIKLTFEVKEQQIKRPRIGKAPRQPKADPKFDPTTPEAIAAATRKHAEQHAAKVAKKAAKAKPAAAKPKVK